MNQELFFCKNFSGKQIVLDENESKHCSQVLRKKVGDVIFITDGKGLKVTGKLVSVHKKECIVHEVKKEVVSPANPYKITIGIGSPSHSQRTEWMIEKLTELGVDEIYLLNTQHVQFAKNKKDRLEKVAVSALKQSIKLHLPRIEINTGFKDFLEKWRNQDFEDKTGLIGNSHPNCPPIKEVLVKSSHYYLLIGPEGDFSHDEYLKADESGFLQISLGKSRLRVETAAICLLNAIHLLN